MSNMALMVERGYICGKDGTSNQEHEDSEVCHRDYRCQKIKIINVTTLV